METQQDALFVVNNVPMYTPARFAAKYDIPLQTVYSAVNSGRIVSHRYGGRRYLVATSADTYAQVYKAMKEGN